VRRLLLPVLLAAAASFPGAAAAAGIGLSASPARLVVVGRAHTSLTVRNPGARALRVDVGRARFALSLRGRPRIGAKSGAARWLSVRPARFRLAPGAVATLTIRAAPPRRAGPGDHAAVVLLTSRPVVRRHVRVRLRVGVVVVVHVPGRIVHRLWPRSLRIHRAAKASRLDLRLVNRGNVTEQLGGGRVRLVLLRGRRVVARLRLPGRELLPRSAGAFTLVHRGRLPRRLKARLEIRP